MIRNLLAGVLLAGVGLAAWSVWLQLDRPVRAVRVEGRLSAAEQGAIRQVVSESLRQGILSLDLGDLGERIHALSWPRTVQVRRVWPDGLVIRVEKESVVAAWGDGGYLNSAGKVVKLADGAGDVPRLATAMAPPRRAMEIYQMLASKLEPHGFAIAHLTENALGEWEMQLDRGITVALGRDAISARLDRFLSAWQRGLASRGGEIARVDTRYDNGVAVRWSDAAKTVGAASWPRTSSGRDSRPGGRAHQVDQGHAGTDYALR